MKNWIEQLQPIIDEYKDGDDFLPLDGDEVDELIFIIKAKINLNEGNITQEEYDSLLDLGAKEFQAIVEAGNYLSNDDLGEAISLIKAQNDIDPSMDIKNIDGIQVWEKIDAIFTVKQFLKMVY